MTEHEFKTGDLVRLDLKCDKSSYYYRLGRKDSTVTPDGPTFEAFEIFTPIRRDSCRLIVRDTKDIKVTWVDPRNGAEYAEAARAELAKKRIRLTLDVFKHADEVVAAQALLDESNRLLKETMCEKQQKD